MNMKKILKLGVVEHAFNSNIWEAEADRSRSAWSRESVSGQLGLCRETLYQKNQKQINKSKKQLQRKGY